MGPVVRSSRGGALVVTVNGLAPEEAAAVQKLIASDKGAGQGPALSVSPAERGNELSGSSPELVLCGTPGSLRLQARALAARSPLLRGFSGQLDSLLDNYLRSDYKIMCRGKILDLGSRTHVMGILNATPDSFSDGGQYAAPERALARARQMAEQGADIIDIGGESTRPGAEPVPEDEELRRIIPLIERLSAELPIPISVDTYKAPVAAKALAAGASIVNDVSGLRFSPDMAAVAAEHGAAVVIMHMKGAPRNMQRNPVYHDVVAEIAAYLEEGIELAVRAGVDREKIMIDPGIGFGKTLDHNLELLKRLDEFRGLGRPIVLGTSRKKFIGTILDVPQPEERVDGTAATVALGIERGAAIVRVHDVARMAQVARMTDAIIKA
jgi:dihydropteroate synthase